MTDINIDNYGDLLFEAGDFKIGESDNQHIFLLLQLQQGELKKYPSCGIGLPAIILDNELLHWRHKIREQLEQDGLIVEALELREDKIILDAKYNN